MIKSVVIKSSDFMKESENVSVKEIAAIVKIWKDISLFAATFIRVRFSGMTYNNARLE